MSAVGITENAKGDNKKFEIWCKSREEVYIVQVPDDILSFIFFCKFLFIATIRVFRPDFKVEEMLMFSSDNAQILNKEG